MCCRLCLIVCWSVGLNKEALHVLILPALFGVRYSYLCSAQDQNKLHIVTQSTKMDTLFDLLTDSISFVGFTLKHVTSFQAQFMFFFSPSDQAGLLHAGAAHRPCLQEWVVGDGAECLPCRVWAHCGGKRSSWIPSPYQAIHIPYLRSTQGL